MALGGALITSEHSWLHHARSARRTPARRRHGSGPALSVIPRHDRSLFVELRRLRRAARFNYWSAVAGGSGRNEVRMCVITGVAGGGAVSTTAAVLDIYVTFSLMLLEELIFQGWRVSRTPPGQ